MVTRKSSGTEWRTAAQREQIEVDQIEMMRTFPVTMDHCKHVAVVEVGADTADRAHITKACRREAASYSLDPEKHTAVYRCRKPTAEQSTGKGQAEAVWMIPVTAGTLSLWRDNDRPLGGA